MFELNQKRDSTLILCAHPFPIRLPSTTIFNCCFILVVVLVVVHSVLEVPLLEESNHHQLALVSPTTLYHPHVVDTSLRDGSFPDDRSLR
jgi:hypothetical protein